MSPAARAWYLAEIRYLADRNADAAARVVDLIGTARTNLAEYPQVGVVGVISGTRRLVAGPYVLTTRQRGGVIEIVAIRHARQGDAYAPDEADSAQFGGS
jgi:plasmid stabilization system protein ParE